MYTVSIPTTFKSTPANYDALTAETHNELLTQFVKGDEVRVYINCPFAGWYFWKTFTVDA